MKTALLKHTPLAVLLASTLLAGCDKSAGKPTLQLSPWGASAQVKAEALAYPEKACILGPVRVIPRELPGMTVSSLDLVLPVAPRRGVANFDALLPQALAATDLLAPLPFTGEGLG